MTASIFKINTEVILIQALLIIAIIGYKLVTCLFYLHSFVTNTSEKLFVIVSSKKHWHCSNRR